jgi:DNA polymerase
VVWGEGDPRARLVLVGEAPGEEEDRQGRPFVGRSGALLGQALAAAGLAREALWITNAVKCRPTKQEGERLANRAPTTRELKAWADVLEAELAHVRPAVVVGLGAVAGRALFGPDFRLTRQRGVLVPAPRLGVPALVTWHPAFVLRQRGPDRDARLAEVVADLGLARREARL